MRETDHLQPLLDLLNYKSVFLAFLQCCAHIFKNVPVIAEPGGEYSKPSS